MSATFKPETGVSLGHTPAGEKWAFDAETTDVFEDMLARSIPQYHVMRDAVFTLGSRYVAPQTEIVDLGCSRGEALHPFVMEYGARNRYIGLEISAPMLAAARERYKGYIDAGVVDIREHDLRYSYPYANASLTLSILAMQFTPLEYRQRIMRDVYASTKAGGAFILVEKILGATSALDGHFIERYYAMKRANGYTQEEIDRKRYSLEGVLVPVTAKWNEELLRDAGFREVDVFWRWMNFAGWIAVKEQ